jgi:hypothetical protein
LPFFGTNTIDDFVLFPEDNASSWNPADMSFPEYDENLDLSQFNFDVSGLNDFPSSTNPIDQSFKVWGDDHHQYFLEVEDESNSNRSDSLRDHEHHEFGTALLQSFKLTEGFDIQPPEGLLYESDSSAPEIQSPSLVRYPPGFDRSLNHNPFIDDQYGLDSWASAQGGDLLVSHTRPRHSISSQDSGQLDSSFFDGSLQSTESPVPLATPSSQGTSSFAEDFWPGGSVSQPQIPQSSSVSLPSAEVDWSVLESGVLPSPNGDLSLSTNGREVRNLPRTESSRKVLSQQLVDSAPYGGDATAVSLDSQQSIPGSSGAALIGPLWNQSQSPGATAGGSLEYWGLESTPALLVVLLALGNPRLAKLGVIALASLLPVVFPLVIATIMTTILFKHSSTCSFGGVLRVCLPLLLPLSQPDALNPPSSSPPSPPIDTQAAPPSLPPIYFHISHKIID